MRELLQEIIDAGQGAEIPLNMMTWHCGSACCLCGDVAAARYPDCDDDDDDWITEANVFAHELDDASNLAFGSPWVALSVYASGRRKYRLEYAERSGLFTPAELHHPHLTTDHHDRAIAHDWIRIVMSKLPEGE